MKNKRIIAALLTGAMLLTGSGALADADKDEIVYAKLGADGAPGEVIVVNAFEADGETDVTDYGAYARTENLSGAEGLTSAGDENAFTMVKGRAYYRGTLADAALPWNIAISYQLNGKEITAEQLAGASGELGLSFDVRKNADCAAPFAERYMLQITVTLPAERFLNVRAEGASVSVSGGDLLVTFALLPGREGRFSLTAEANGAELSPVTFAGVPMGFDLSGLDLSAVTSQLDPLTAGVASFRDGAAQVSEGLRQTDAGFGAWLAGFDEFAKGLEGYLGGAASASDGAVRLRESAVQLGEGLTPLLEGLSAVPAYQQSAAQLKAGWEGFYEGLCQALDGTAALGGQTEPMKAALDELQAGAQDLGSGLGGLSQGAERVASGAGQMADELAKTDMTAAAGEAVSALTGGEYAPVSFVSSKNENVRMVQFVLMTDAIRLLAPESKAVEAPQKGLWDRICDLFR